MLENKKHKHNNKNELKKSQIMLFGSLLVFGGIVALNWPKLVDIRNELYSDMLILFSEENVQVVEDVPITEEVAVTTKPVEEEKPIDYSKYLGVLEIPKIHFKRGFYKSIHSL
jgi:hypothetical protein